MNIRTVRATANNLIEALRLDTEQAKRVAHYELTRFGTEEDAKATINYVDSAVENKKDKDMIV